MKHKIRQTYEIAGAILAKNINDEEREALKKDTNLFMESQGLDLDNIKINVIENDNENINLALPYYSAIDESSARLSNAALSDDDLDAVSGGEVLLVLPIVLGTAFVGGAVAFGTAVAAVSYNLQDKNLDGSPK